MNHDETAPARLAASDPALMITGEELARSRQRSLAFMDSEVTHLTVSGSVRDFHPTPARRYWGRLAGAGLATAAVAASVLIAANMATEPVNVAAAPTVSEVTAVPAPPTGPAHDLFIAADEVLVLQALPNPAEAGPEGLGVEPVNVIQVLKGSRPLGKSTIDASNASTILDPGMWRTTNTVAPLTYVAFIKKDADGLARLMNEPLALLQILDLRSVTFGDALFQKPVDVGADLASRISVGPTDDVPLSTYPAAQAGTSNVQRTPEGTIRGHVTAAEACFTFDMRSEKVLLRWPAGYTATTRLLPASPEGDFRIDGTSATNRAVVLNEWGVLYAYDGDTRPLLSGTRTNEQADCNGQTLPVFDVAPGGVGVSPFRISRGTSGPNTQTQ